MFFPEGTYREHPEASCDNTHLRYEGAVLYGSLIAEGLRRMGGIYASLLAEF